MDMAEGRAIVSQFTQHSTMSAIQATEADMRRITQDISPKDKVRPDMFPGDTREGYRMRAIDGYSMNIGQLGKTEHTKRPGLFLRGTAVQAAREILRTGIKSVKRNEIHLVDYRRARRQAKYIFRNSREGVW